MMGKALVLIVILGALYAAVEGAPSIRIVGGSDAKPGQFPYMVSLQVKYPHEEKFHHDCGGSILTNRTILTAAHCVWIMNELGLKYQVYVGSTDSDEGGMAYEGENYIYHQDFNIYPSIRHDVAVVHLKEAITFTPLVQPIVLDIDSIGGGENVTASGWGLLKFDPENPVFTKKLQFLNLQTIDQEICKKILEDEDGLTPHESHFCVLNKAGEGLCKGDSGSPVVRDGKQVGVISWSGKLCAEGVPDGIARVSTDYEWIKSVTI